MNEKKRIAVIGGGAVGRLLVSDLETYAPKVTVESLQKLRDDMESREVDLSYFDDIETFNRENVERMRRYAMQDALDLSSLEKRWLGYDPAFGKDSSMGKTIYVGQMRGRMCRNFQNLPKLPHHKPDRQPRGKAFKQMVKLGYEWSGKI